MLPDIHAGNLDNKELVAGILPGVIVVPDLFVAMSHAQKRGLSYIFID